MTAELQQQLAEARQSAADAKAETKQQMAEVEKLRVEMTEAQSVVAWFKTALAEAGPSDSGAARKPKPADPRRPKPFSGEGSQDQAGEVRRFTHAMSVFFDVAHIPAQDHVAYARLNLEGAAADYVHTAMQSMPDGKRTDWETFCACLNARFGCIDPDADFWDQLRDLKQRDMTVAQYVNKMQYCFNGITVLPLSAGEKIERFRSGLNPALLRLMVTAPIGMGVNGKWTDPDNLMEYAILQGQALQAGGAVHTPSSSHAEVRAPKRSHDGSGSNKSKKKHARHGNGGNGNGGHANGSGGGNGNGGHRTGGFSDTKFRSAVEKKWLADNQRCFHCCQAGHTSSACPTRQSAAADMPKAFGKSPKA